MSRIGKIPVKVPKEVKVKVEKEQVHLESSKGKLELNIPQGIDVELKDEQLFVKRRIDLKQTRANHGSTRAHLVNMITGLTQGHKKELEIQGIGFRAQLKGKQVVLVLGFSHPVEYDIPQDVKVSVPAQTSIVVEGPDKTRVGEVAAQIRALKPVEPYKGKGIRYFGEHVLRKQGKSLSKT